MNQRQLPFIARNMQFRKTRVQRVPICNLLNMVRNSLYSTVEVTIIAQNDPNPNTYQYIKYNNIGFGSFRVMIVTDPCVQGAEGSNLQSFEAGQQFLVLDCGGRYMYILSDNLGEYWTQGSVTIITRNDPNPMLLYLFE
jgi:hypothetical protein